MAGANESGEGGGTPWAGLGRRFRDASVKSKMLGTAGIALVLTVIIGVLGILSLGANSAATDRIVSGNLPSVRALDGLKLAAAQTQVDMAMHVTAADPGARAGLRRQGRAGPEGVRQRDDGVPRGAVGHPPAMVSLHEDWALYVHIAKTAQLPAGERGDLPSWQIIRNAEVAPLMEKIYADLQSLADLEQAEVTATTGAAHTTYVNGLTRAVILLVVGSLLVVGLSLAVSNGVVARLRRVKDVCEALASGDLTATTDLDSNDEVGKMGQALNTATHNIREVVAAIDTSAGSLSGACRQHVRALLPHRALRRGRHGAHGERRRPWRRRSGRASTSSRPAGTR